MPAVLILVTLSLDLSLCCLVQLLFGLSLLVLLRSTAVWLLQLLKKFTRQFFTPLVIFEENATCIAYVKNNNIPKRSKHIDTR